MAPWWSFLREPKHVGADFIILICFNNPIIHIIECISWIIKYLLLLMHGLTTKKERRIILMYCEVPSFPLKYPSTNWRQRQVSTILSSSREVQVSTLSRKVLSSGSGHGFCLVPDTHLSTLQNHTLSPFVHKRIYLLLPRVSLTYFWAKRKNKCRVPTFIYFWTDTAEKCIRVYIKNMFHTKFETEPACSLSQPTLPPQRMLWLQAPS